MIIAYAISNESDLEGRLESSNKKPSSRPLTSETVVCKLRKIYCQFNPVTAKQSQRNGDKVESRRGFATQKVTINFK